jgi:hypothetical protein
MPKQISHSLTMRCVHQPNYKTGFPLHGSQNHTTKLIYRLPPYFNDPPPVRIRFSPHDDGPR